MNFRHNFEAAPVFIMIENFVIAELNKLVGFENGDGVFVPGKTFLINFIFQCLCFISNITIPVDDRQGLGTKRCFGDLLFVCRCPN